MSERRKPMKKLLIVLFSLLMILSLCGCQKVKEEETEEISEEEIAEAEKEQISITIDHGNGVTKDFSMKSDSDLLIDALSAIKATGMLEYEIKGSEILSMDGFESNDESGWVLYVNDETYEGDIEKMKFKEGDKILFVYETKPIETMPQLLGGWMINEDYKEKLSNDEKKIFESITSEVIGVNYVPVRVIATQAASGVNYAYLAQGISMTDPVELNYYIMVVYKDLDGSCEVKAINKIDIPDMMTMENSDPVFLRSWMVIKPDEKDTLKNKEVLKSFNKAIEGHDGLVLTPIELLASQLVSGTNYIALCHGETVTLDPVSDLYIVEWYEDLNGKCSITRIENLNLQYYVAGE